jgi:hypothetical protein
VVTRASLDSGNIRALACASLHEVHPVRKPAHAAPRAVDDVCPRRPALKAQDLIGTWRLRSWKNLANDGSSVEPLGDQPVGFIFYNHDGYMSVEIMARDRAPYAVPDAFGGTPQERSDAISTYLSYSGPFEVLSDEDTVIHHIEVSSFPNWIGKAQVRFAQLEGNVLVLSTKPMIFQGVERRAELVWRRVGQDET